MHGLFFVGTDTAVGKTRVAAMAARNLLRQGVRVGAYKPAASGVDHNGRWSDVDILKKAIGDEFPDRRICPQCFDAPLAPPEAARQQGQQVDQQLLTAGALWWNDQVDLLIVEGVGGLLCPLTDTMTVADLASELGWPVVIVARNQLGTINHTLLTLEAARNRNLAVAGIVLNQPTPPDPCDQSTATNARTIARLGHVDVLGQLDYQAADLLPLDDTATIDWSTLAEHHD